MLFLGQPSSSVRDIRVTSFCRIISEFSLEYRTTRERVLTLKQKRAAHRERTKTRGKMITEVMPRGTCVCVCVWIRLVPCSRGTSLTPRGNKSDAGTSPTPRGNKSDA